MKSKNYLRRERNKKLPQGVNYWDFDCKYGVTEKETIVINVTEINKKIDGAKKANLESFYLELIATAGHRKKKEESE